MFSFEKLIMFIQDVPRDKKFWVVRSGDGGIYYDHFLQNSIVAIGHIDELDYGEIALKDEKLVDELVIRYKQSLLMKKEPLASVTNRTGQVLRFIKDISIGDYVMTMDSKRIAVGVITSDPYKNINKVTIRDNNDDSISSTVLEFTLRRNVSWGKTQYRDKLPLAINNSFRANQSVFSASDHWKELNHWMSVAFISDGDAYISSRIEQRDGISNLDVTQYSTIINKIEAAADLLASDSVDVNTEDELIGLLEAKYKELRKRRSFTVTTQQVFLSPGDLWAKTSGGRNKSLLVVAMFLMLFDITPTYSNKDDSDFVSEHRDKMLVMLDEIKKEESFSDVQKGLDLRVPSQKMQDNSPLNENPQDKLSGYQLDDFEGI
ncbi:hypothetical protein PROVALCAL_04077 [Providencia alcalifaciens DSM 30120]|uniref:Uncharacterized protein n=3 Tax=Morganellaceae TaxID=1903414 RepID=B6XL15_9GAMM|nr:hypothetical protein PROVALCAL_04077 [Providencia alcalifaciens DSM 30120]